MKERKKLEAVVKVGNEEVVRIEGDLILKQTFSSSSLVTFTKIIPTFSDSPLTIGNTIDYHAFLEIYQKIVPPTIPLIKEGYTSTIKLSDIKS